MMRILLLFTGLYGTVLCSSQPVVHFDFVTHNEETPQWNATPFYMTNRARLLALADHFQANGIAWNMQSDWVYLTNVLTKETPLVTANTAGKNILRWLQEDKGVEMDPHAHESQYIYPDVVALMDSIGLPESKLMGGSIYNDYNGINLWMNLVNGQHGVIFPDRFWQPDYMMGGGTPNHVDDLKYYGFWNPHDTDSYLVHDPLSHLRHIGVGCSIKIQDTTSVAYVMQQVHDVVDDVQAGVYPPDGFYVQSIFFEQTGLNDLAFYEKVVDVADSVTTIVSTGVADWRTLKQSYTQWEDDGAEVFQWECGETSTGMATVADEPEITVVPSLFSDHLALHNGTGEERCELRDAMGRWLWSGTQIERQDLSGLSSGPYLLIVSDNSFRRAFKVAKQ